MGIRKIGTNTEILNQILKMAIPISIGATVGTVMSLIDAILVPQKLIQSGVADPTALYGQLTGKASVLVNIPLTLSMALCTSLIPIIAENYVLKRKTELHINIRFINPIMEINSRKSFISWNLKVWLVTPNYNSFSSRTVGVANTVGVLWIGGDNFMDA